MEKKYILTEETKLIDGHTLHRIQAVKDFDDVKAGDLGGWIETEENLSHEGTCWVADKALVYEDAFACGNAKIFNHAMIHGFAQVYGDARVCGNTELFDYSLVRNSASIYGAAKVYGCAVVCDNAKVLGSAHVYDRSYVCANAHVFSNSEIHGNVVIMARNRFAADADISSSDDFITIGPIGSRGDYVTFYKTKDHAVRVCTGCFVGRTLEEFERAVVSRHSGTIHAKMYRAAIELAKSKLLA